MPSISPGRNGRSSCTRSNGNGWNATTLARRESPVRPAQARLSLRCIEPSIWPARIQTARVLLTTFSDTLASALQTKLKRLVSGEPRLAERIDVYSLDAIGLRLYKSHIAARRPSPAAR